MARSTTISPQVKNPTTLRAVASPATVYVTEEDIARRAYEAYEARGRQDGHDLDDWLQAERELREVQVLA